ncbi:hypothetical protein NDU88_006932 [Pleurodeles waltl]|uniref:Uncharacterized protein n=1 Tax=Pleurodeles waltl TaxID=8319 RepID=A0AAV7P0T9_PLEWA|nr:hypothetical protein NDU88_006932 [Pleurodeles waltl]
MFESPRGTSKRITSAREEEHADVTRINKPLSGRKGKGRTLEWKLTDDQRRKQAKTQWRRDHGKPAPDQKTRSKEQRRGTGDVEKPATSLQGCGSTSSGDPEKPPSAQDLRSHEETHYRAPGDLRCTALREAQLQGRSRILESREEAASLPLRQPELQARPPAPE